MPTSRKAEPTWSDVKAELASFDRAALMALVQSLYAANRDNKIFLHTRFGLGEDVLKPYKATLDRWLWPDVFKNQRPSVAKAKKAIADYRKAIGEPEGLADLMVFFCERAAGFSRDVGLDEGDANTLVLMFGQAVNAVADLPAEQKSRLLPRLDAVRCVGHTLGYCVGDEMDGMLVEYGVDGGSR